MVSNDTDFIHLVKFTKNWSRVFINTMNHAASAVNTLIIPLFMSKVTDNP